MSISSIDFDSFVGEVEWSLQRPKCPTYEGSSLCSYWRSWIAQGRGFYSNDKEGEREYTNVLKEKAPGLRLLDIRRVLSAK